MCKLASLIRRKAESALEGRGRHSAKPGRGPDLHELADDGGQGEEARVPEDGGEQGDDGEGHRQGLGAGRHDLPRRSKPALLEFALNLLNLQISI